jgi:mono/diheme cytochrome c family protein
VRPPPVAGGRTGCGSCHAPHHLREGTCQDCHRGDPGAEREELAHARLVAGRAAEHGLPGGLAPREGRRLVARLACRRCHVIGGEGNRLAADLDRVVWSREQGQLVASLLEPVDFMPAFGLDQAQAEAIVAYLLRRASREGGQDAYRVHFERHAEAGGSAFETHCGGCHRVITAAGPGGTGSDGPNLSGLFTRFYPPPPPATGRGRRRRSPSGCATRARPGRTRRWGPSGSTRPSSRGWSARWGGRPPPPRASRGTRAPAEPYSS